MKRFEQPLSVRAVTALATCAALVASTACAGVVNLMIPSEGATVSLMSAEQRAFALSGAERHAVWTNPTVRAEWVATGWEPRPVTFVWDGVNSRKESLRFRLVRVGDGACVIETNLLYLTTSRFEVENLRVATDYRWELDVAGKGMVSQTFRTEDLPPRLLHVPGVPNVRDLGGWRTADGRRVRQGLLYRSANLCENAGECPDGRPRLRTTPATRRYLSETLGIRTELDLRSPKECGALPFSPVGECVRRVEISSGCYGQMDEPWAKDAVRRDLELIADAANLPLLFHCSSGRDRTGTLAFLVNGLLGVSAEDLARDWETTALWNAERDWFNPSVSYAQLLAVMDRYPGDTLNVRIESYVRSTGFSDADLARLRAQLTEM